MNVWPKNDQMRAVLTHPSGNIAFHEVGPIDWPDDSFTHRRVADGDVLLEDPNSPKEFVPDKGKVSSKSGTTE